jgi:uncharacterized protein YndB with AHSA1/START domain
MDFRVGGRESTRFLFQGGPEGTPPTEIRNDTTYQDIVPQRCIVFAYTMTIGDKRISASLAKVELCSSGDGIFDAPTSISMVGPSGPESVRGGFRMGTICPALRVEN